MPKETIVLVLQSKLNNIVQDAYSVQWLKDLAEGSRDKRTVAYNKVFNKLGRKK